MTSAAPGPQETVEVLPAPPGLAPLVVCAIRRSVVAGAQVSAQVHANTYACLNVIRQGSVQAGSTTLPHCFVTGPFTRPLATRAQGPLRSLSLVFQPWLLPALCGAEPAGMADRLLDAAPLAHPRLDRLAAAALAAADAAEGIAPLWASLAGELAAAPTEPELALETLSSRGVQAAAARCGLSERQYRRRFRQHMALPPAAWARIRRWEHALGALARQQSLALSALAAEAGYADQAHLSREVRAFVRQPPGRLQRDLAGGGGTWSVQAAHVRSVQDRRPDRP